MSNVLTDPCSNPEFVSCSNELLSPVEKTRRSGLEFSKGLVRTLKGWRMRNRDRHVVAEMDVRLLRNMGVYSSENSREANKLFW